MIRSYARATAILALPILIVTTAADAQQRRQRVDQMSAEARAARQACFREAQARVPGPRGHGAVSRTREVIYRDCIHNKGFRP